MKTRIKFSFFVFFALLSHSIFATVINHASMASSPQTNIQLKHLTAKDYGKMIGKKLSLRDKIVFHFAKKELLTQNATVDRQTLDKAVGYNSSDFNLGGFLLGFILSIIGVLIALLFGGNVLRWAWKGFWISVLVWLIGILIGRN